MTCCCDDRLEHSAGTTPKVRSPKSSFCLAVFQVIFGSLLILLEIVGLGIGTDCIDFVTISGAGIWCGVLFATTGTVGVFASRRPVKVHRRLWIAFLVLSIISSVLAFALFLTSCVDVGFFTDHIPIERWCASRFYKSSSYYSSYNVNVNVGLGVTRGYPTYYANSYPVSDSWSSEVRNAALALRILSVLLYFVLFVMFIVTASFGCCNVCGRRRRTTSTGNVMVYQVQSHAALGLNGGGGMANANVYMCGPYNGAIIPPPYYQHSTPSSGNWIGEQPILMPMPAPDRTANAVNPVLPHGNAKSDLGLLD